MNMPMIAIMAKRPFVNSAANFFISNARSGESEHKAQSTPGAARQVVLDEHADDRHHGQVAIRQLGCQSFLLERAPASRSIRHNSSQALRAR